MSFKLNYKIWTREVKAIAISGRFPSGLQRRSKRLLKKELEISRRDLIAFTSRVQKYYYIYFRRYFNFKQSKLLEGFLSGNNFKE